MGSWINHLCIAENLLECWPHLDAALFTLGNLAPDSGISDETWSTFDPPKTTTHFLPPGGAEGDIRDLDFYHQYVRGLVPDDDPARYSFLLGYFTHLVCDNLDGRRLGQACRQQYASLFAHRGSEAWWDLKKDAYDCDHVYVRDHRQSLFWRVFLVTPNPPSPLPFIPEHALHHQLNYIRTFYSQPQERFLDRVYPLINAATMARFVADSTGAIMRLWRLLQEAPVPPRLTSALALLRDEEIAAYTFPLGDTSAS